MGNRWSLTNYPLIVITLKTVLFSLFSSLAAVVDDLHNYVHPVSKRPAPMISDEIHSIITRNAEVQVHTSTSPGGLSFILSSNIELAKLSLNFSFSAPQLCHHLWPWLQLSVLWIQGGCVNVRRGRGANVWCQVASNTSWWLCLCMHEKWERGSGLLMYWLLFPVPLEAVWAQF